MSETSGFRNIGFISSRRGCGKKVRGVTWIGCITWTDGLKRLLMRLFREVRNAFVNLVKSMLCLISECFEFGRYFMSVRLESCFKGFLRYENKEELLKNNLTSSFIYDYLNVWWKIAVIWMNWLLRLREELPLVKTV
jgi:hypothetical protein